MNVTSATILYSIIHARAVMAAKGNMEVIWGMLNLRRLKFTLLSTSGHFGERVTVSTPRDADNQQHSY